MFLYKNISLKYVPLQKHFTYNTIHYKNICLHYFPLQNIYLQYVPYLKFCLQNIPLENICLQYVPLPNICLGFVPLQKHSRIMPSSTKCSWKNFPSTNHQVTSQHIPGKKQSLLKSSRIQIAPSQNVPVTKQPGSKRSHNKTVPLKMLL